MAIYSNGLLPLSLYGPVIGGQWGNAMTSMGQGERRLFGRRGGRIEAMVSGRGIVPVACVIQNFSDKGAMLEFAETAPDSPIFHLMIGAKGIDILCQVRHRAPAHIGVSFAGGDVERFMEAFGARPVLGQSLVQPRAVEQQTDQRVGSRSLRRAVFGENSTEQSERPAMIVALVERLAAIPEFAAAGFRVEPGRDPGELALYHRAARRGFWRQDTGALHWFATGLGGDQHEAASVDAAVYHTMSIVLGILSRQRRPAAQVTAAETSTPTLAQPL